MKVVVVFGGNRCCVFIICKDFDYFVCKGSLKWF